MSNIREPYYNVRRVQNRNNQIDTHEILKGEIYKQSDDNNYQLISPSFAAALAANQPGQAVVQQAPAPTSSGNPGIADTFLYFESSARDTSSDLANGEIKFSITALNNSQPIDNCIAIRLGDFYFPLVKNAAAAPEYYFFRRVYALISSISSIQAYQAPNSTQFHFEFDIENLTSVAVRLIPVNPSFYFKTPLTSLTEFSLRFYAPNGTGGFKKIPIPKDSLTVRADNGTNPAQFTILGGDDITNLIDSALITAFPLVPSPTIAVYITGFSSASAALNNSTNSTQGLFVDNFPTDMYTFEISSLDYSTLGVDTECTLHIAKNRIAIPVRMTSVTTNNNYITATHD